ncbi:MAG TPA: RNA polymerase sigma factor [Acidobacteriaceae bacterium]|nr:RNA polymerase sigma factor [Acidobacteriaceae bacterium]
MAIAHSGLVEVAARERWTDEEIVERVKCGETALYEILMRRYNQRIYRVVRSILREDGEAEDVMQDAYVSAYQHLHQLRGEAPFSTWLTRIAANEALHRLRLRKRVVSIDDTEWEGDGAMNPIEGSPDPEQSASISELGDLLEEALLDLPQPLRVVVMLRDVEEMTTAETAAVLDLTEENVKVRLHRGRRLARKWLFKRVAAGTAGAFPFMGARCDRVVSGVFSRIAEC